MGWPNDYCPKLTARASEKNNLRATPNDFPVRHATRTGAHAQEDWLVSLSMLTPTEFEAVMDEYDTYGSTGVFGFTPPGEDADRPFMIVPQSFRPATHPGFTDVEMTLRHCPGVEV